jgi:hypothetical protein
MGEVFQKHLKAGERIVVGSAVVGSAVGYATLVLPLSVGDVTWQGLTLHFGRGSRTLHFARVGRVSKNTLHSAQMTAAESDFD